MWWWIYWKVWEILGELLKNDIFLYSVVYLKFRILAIALLSVTLHAKVAFQQVKMWNTSASSVLSGYSIVWPVVYNHSYVFGNSEFDVKGYLYATTFICGRCHRSWAAGTPDKYERDLKYWTYALPTSHFPVTEKLTNRALVTPTPGVTAKPSHCKAFMCWPIIGQFRLYSE